MLAARLREHMETRELSQSDIARLAGASQPMVSRMLQQEHQARLDSVEAVAAALRIRPVSLLVSADEAELLDLFARLPAESKAEAVRSTRLLSRQAAPPKQVEFSYVFKPSADAMRKAAQDFAKPIATRLRAVKVERE